LSDPPHNLLWWQLAGPMSDLFFMRRYYTGQVQSRNLLVLIALRRRALW